MNSLNRETTIAKPNPAAFSLPAIAFFRIFSEVILSLFLRFRGEIVRPPYLRQ